MKVLNNLDFSTLTGLVLAVIALPFLSVLGNSNVANFSSSIEIVLTFIAGGVLLIIVYFWENRGLDSVGLRRPKLVDLIYFLIAFVLGFIALAFTDPLISLLGLKQAGNSGLGALESGVGLAVLNAISIGIVEELLYRGYLIERLSDILGNDIAAGLTSCFLFTASHSIVWSTGDLIQVGLTSLVFTGIYIKRKSIIPLIAAHSGIWLLGILGAIYG